MQGSVVQRGTRYSTVADLRPARRPSTLRGYRQLLEGCVIPVIGHRRLDELDPLLLTKLYGQLLTTPKQRQVGLLSPRTVRTHTVLSRAFADAVRWRLLSANPARGARPPAAAACRAPEMKTWTLVELQRLLAGTADTADHVGYVLAACAGLRRGEVCGLRWSDVELEPASGPPHLRVGQQLVLVDKQLMFTAPKTAASRAAGRARQGDGGAAAPGAAGAAEGQAGPRSGVDRQRVGGVPRRRRATCSPCSTGGVAPGR